ncbi:MAG: 4-hydroxy-tetrahydrodipicolinate synthase, partial [Micromonosporaceae bacterium]|nr:4-hydroxy-tetrahydrodipicolinate synthase [Micromonosporaceae bacterium]
MTTDVRDRLATVVAITVTPFDDSGALDVDAYVKVVARMAGAGITAITPNGNTSEFYSLSDEEAAACVDATFSAVSDEVLVVPGVGHDVARAVKMAQYAEGAGAPAVMVHQPVHPFKSVEGWVDFHRAIADAVPDLGLVAYVRDPLFTADALAALAEAVPTL